MRSWVNVLGVLLCIVFLVVVWFIYAADIETQWAVTESAFGIWGFVTGVAKLLLAAGMLWVVGYVWREARSVPGGWGGFVMIVALAWTAFAVPASLLLVIQALVDIFV